MNQFSSENPNLGGQQFNNPGFGGGQANLPNATAVLILGIVSIVGCFCYGIVGIICGIIALILAGKDRKMYNANPASYTEASLKNLNAGRICAIIGLILSSLYIVSTLGFLLFYGTAALTDPTIFLDKYK